MIERSVKTFLIIEIHVFCLLQATNEYVEATPTKGGPLAMNPRKGKYSVASPDQEEEPLYAQVERTPVKK